MDKLVDAIKLYRSDTQLRFRQEYTYCDWKAVSQYVGTKKPCNCYFRAIELFNKIEDRDDKIEIFGQKIYN